MAQHHAAPCMHAVTSADLFEGGTLLGVDAHQPASSQVAHGELGWNRLESQREIKQPRQRTKQITCYWAGGGGGGIHKLPKSAADNVHLPVI